MKKQLTVFYSWQSDIPAKFNRTFIEKALTEALKRLRTDATLEPALRETEIKLDKDTQGIAGSPPIAQTILKKIEECAVFVADLTFVGESSQQTKEGRKRLFSNPNVLIEYGYALRCHGHERLVAVVNTAFGESHTDNLPFDLKHLRWPISYEWSGLVGEQKKTQLETLVRRLVEALGLILANQSPIQSAIADFVPQKSTKDPSIFFDDPSDLIPESNFGGKPQPFIVPDEGRIYLRLYPAYAVPAIPTELDAKLLLGKGGLWPMGKVRGCDHVRNVFGAISYEGVTEGNLYNFTQLCLSREIWGVDAHAVNATQTREWFRRASGKEGAAYIASGYVEQVFVETLQAYIEFAQKILELPLPLRVEAGLVGVKGLPIAVDNYGARGGALTDRIQWQAEILSYDTPALELLQPFFTHVWAKCGVVRPESRKT